MVIQRQQITLLVPLGHAGMVQRHNLPLIIEDRCA
jgi:hypothetical protein